MAKRRKLARLLKRTQPPHTAAVIQQAKRETNTLRADVIALINKASFLVRRAEFLYQGAITTLSHAQELSNDAAGIRQNVVQLSSRHDKIEERLQKARKRRRR